MWWILATVAAVALSYWLFMRPYKYWIQKGVKQGNPRFFFGDNWGTILRKQSFAEMIEMVYTLHPTVRYSGLYQFFQPTLLIRDPDLIKQITVKDFDHFLDHVPVLPEDGDPLWNKTLVALNGTNWREMRTKLSPAFTSSKMKYMFSLITQSGEQFVNYFLKKNENLITMEMKDTFTRFANDVIANTAFGIESDSLRERNNEFYLMGKEITDFSGFWKTFKLFGDFFNNLIKTNIQSRERHGIVRPDMLHLLLEARKNGLTYEETQPAQDTGFATVEETEINKNPKNSKTEITDQDIISQAMIFFFAGFETVSALMCFMSYELAVNPDVQDKLIQEVDEALEACDGKLTYEAVLSMKYMDMVVSETLRKWPPAVATDRLCTKPYTIEPARPGEKPLHLEKNSMIWIPIFGLHRDPLYYPEPDRFIPERFSDENKTNIEPYTYLPFGTGPRNCIGSRFALLETKILFLYILSQFSVVPVKKTQIPLVICKKQFNLTAENGVWLGLKRRCKA